jgi:protein-S-isoprenylcysteine O-methyltransferase Ste14
LLDTVIFFGIFMIALPWLAHWFVPQPVPLPTIVRIWGGALLFAVGVGGWLTCLEVFARRGRGTPFPGEAPSRLVTTGLFAIVRNPIIVSELLVIWGEALYVASAGIVLYGFAVTLSSHLVVLHIEEPELRQRFGESYQEYCENVPRWFPRLHSIRTTSR